MVLYNMIRAEIGTKTASQNIKELNLTNFLEKSHFHENVRDIIPIIFTSDRIVIGVIL